MHQPIAGSVEAIAQLREAGHRVLFVTNNSFSTVADQEQALEKIGVSAKGEVCTSSQAAGLLLSPHDRVLLGGGPGVMEAIIESGATLVARSDDGSRDLDIGIDAVVVGYHNTFDYWGLLRLAGAVRAGARLIATNDDATYPTPNGLIPGGGSILASIVEASGVRPTIGGSHMNRWHNLFANDLASKTFHRLGWWATEPRPMGCLLARLAANLYKS